MATIKETVAEKLSLSGEVVFNTVVEQLTQEKIQDRVKSVIKGLSLKDEITKELNKIKPDVVVYHEDGSVKDSSWSKLTLERKKKLNENYSKVENAINVALEANTNEAYGKLNEVLNNVKVG